jgi:hypothetical protein
MIGLHAIQLSVQPAQKVIAAPDALDEICRNR